MVLATDLDVRGSGGATETDPDNWLGGAISNTELSPTVAEENLFNNVLGAEAATGSTKYRGLYFRNGHATETLTLTKLWISSNTPSGDTTIDVALAGEGLNTQMESVINEDTAPIGETFSAPATYAAGLSMGSVPATQFYGFWVRRTVTAAAGAQDNDDCTFDFQGDSPS